MTILADKITVLVCFDGSEQYVLDIVRIPDTNNSWEWSLDDKETGTIFNHDGRSLELLEKILHGRDVS